MTRCLYRPRPVKVRTGAGGVPVGVRRASVEAVREQWIVEDRWWTTRPIRRRYFELATDDGSDVVVFFDEQAKRWFNQPGA